MSVSLALLSPRPANAAPCTTLDEARTAGIHWLERNQDRWLGSGDVLAPALGERTTEGVVAAEALLALAESGRSAEYGAQRAAAWLRGQEVEATDFRARRIRALAVAGLDVAAERLRLCEERGSQGWGVLPGGSPGAYDTALAYAAVDRASCGSLTGEEHDTIFLRGRHADKGWAGDQVDPAAEPSDPVATAEIVRALSADYANLTAELNQSIGLLGNVTAGALGTLEIASRLAALHSLGATNAGLQGELVSRCDTESAWEAGTGSDFEAAHVNAMALLAIATRPSATFTDPGSDPDRDGDGIPDDMDDDKDGDGIANAVDPFELDPTNPVDTDGDSLADRVDPDDDDDGIPDVDELMAGTNPLAADSDGDGSPDNTDPCPRIAYELRPNGEEWGVDADGDGICTPQDRCDDYNSAEDYADLDGDGICDGLDADADGDGFRNYVEAATGSDDRQAALHPSSALLVDSDGDGLTDADETYHPTYVLDPTLADSDSDGADDWAELGAGTDPGLASSQPPPVVAVLSNVSPAECYVGGSWVAWDPVVCGGGLGPIYGAMTAGQPTPIASTGGEDPLPAGAGFENLAGFQPQVLTFDADGDGLMALLENAARTSDRLGDTDGDGFADGHDGFLAKVPGGPEFDLDGDGTVDGELDAGTDPLDPEDHLGSAGDVAPLGHPDGAINAGDAVVLIRMAGDSSVTEGLPDDNKRIAEQAADVAPATAPDGVVDSADALEILQQVMD